ncbi:MAG TPA: class I SAM-dependent methyltransferase, partial [Burkholderiales bacterium]
MDAQPARRVYAGLFLVSFATLCFEILLTRIFSVTLWYHFAFIAVSVAMFGMTVGALAVYLRPAWFPAGRTAPAMAGSAAAFGVTLVAAVIVHLSLPTLSPLRLSLTYAVTLVPFFFSGVCVCLALTRFPAAANPLYAADLAGAALGCIGYVALLSVMDGISAVFATAALAAAAAFAFLPEERKTPRQASAVLLAFACLLTAASNFAFLQKQPLVRFAWVKIGPEHPPVFERWNAYSRITVHNDAPDLPVLWGASPAYHPDRRVNQAWLRMDALAGTILTEFKGDLREVDYLRYDITNLAHHLRPGGRTLVLGAGGGRDVLSALVFGARQVVAVEINGIILDTVNRRYGDYTGHLDRLPGVTFVHDEARSWVQRSGERFDLIQASWIDTWAATAAGALALTENSLYTLEAWRSFLDRLTPGGLLTFTRSYEEND